MPGHYRIFLGMAAGVGKTYRMLAEAQAEAEAGRDVVIGLLETHGRAETEALADGLEVVPRRRVAVPRREASRRWTCPAIVAPRARAVPDRRARAHQRARRRAPEALRGHRRRAGGRHRRLLDRQRPAPRVAQRPGGRADRRARARDRARRRARARRRDRARRPPARGPDRAPARRQGVRAGARAERAERVLPGREPARAARGRAAPGGRERRGAAASRTQPIAERLLAFVGLDEPTSGSCAAPGAPRSGSAGELDVLVVRERAAVGAAAPSGSRRCAG